MQPLRPKKQRSKSSPKSPRKPQAKPTRNRKRAAGAPARRAQAPDDSGGFLSLLLQRIGWDQLNGLNQRKHGAGRPTHVLHRGQLLAALAFHYTVGWAGRLAEHVFCLLGFQMAESTLSERRQALSFEVFAQLLRRMLRPIGQAGPQAFFGGWRLAAIDGVTFSLANTESVQRKCKKEGNQKGRAAFAKLQCAVLMELVMHNPLAALIGMAGQSEWKLALGLLEQLPHSCLLAGTLFSRIEGAPGDQ